MASKRLGVSLWLVDRLYHSARKICGGLDLNDAISWRYGLGPTETSSRFNNPGDGPEADGQTQHRGCDRKTDVFAHGSLLVTIEG